MNVREAMAALGVQEPFDENDISIAFKRAVKLSHPDIGGSGCDMKRLTDAKAALLSSLASCRACGGKGAAGGFKCKSCNGRGR